VPYTHTVQTGGQKQVAQATGDELQKTNKTSTSILAAQDPGSAIELEEAEEKRLGGPRNNIGPE
jgi:hypothetical protein